MATEHLIAIVDDDQSARESVTDLVQSMGFAARAFVSGEEFLKKGSVQGTSCLVADIQMPGMSGLALRKQLAVSGHDIPTVLMTACPNDRDWEEAARLGVVCYLAKPLDDKVLLACFQIAFASRETG